MLSDHKFYEFLNRLSQRAFLDQVNWQRGNDVIQAGQVVGDQYLIQFASSTFSIAHAKPVGEPEYLLAELANTSGQVLKSVRAILDGPNWQLLLGIHKAASESDSVWMPLVDEIMQTIKDSERVGLLSTPTENDPPQLFFRMAAGKWRLSYRERGCEDLRIDDAGNYFVSTKEGEIHLYTLENVLFDASTNHVSFNKVDTGMYKPAFPKGHIRQREVLDLSSDGKIMEGYAEHDRHSVKYVRVEG